MLLDTLLSQLAPFECLQCGAEGHLICGACTPALERVPTRCYRCRRLTGDFRTCVACRSQTPLFSVRPALIYKDVAKDLVWQLKFNGAQAAAKEMATLMAPLLPVAPVLLVPVPTATSRARHRGYDQAIVLAKELSRLSHLPYAKCLRRHGQAEQLGATRQQRVTQLQHAYRCINAKLLAGRHIVLVDDVVTTGATLEAAARSLKAAGAARVSAIVFAQA